MAHCWQCSAEVAENDYGYCQPCVALGVVTQLGFAGRYRILAFVGRGAFGEVYKCLDTRLGRTVAVKAAISGAISEEEAETALRAHARLKHPGIVDLCDIIVADGLIVMEFVEGTDLKFALDNRRPWLIANFCGIAQQLADALRSAHLYRVGHRDLKPGNILISDDATVKIADFGLARLFEGRALADSQVGTPAYAAPEQFQGTPYRLDVDVYALGTIFFEIWTGQLPFQGGSMFALGMLKAAGQRIADLRDLNSEAPEWLEDLVDTMLVAESGMRPTAEMIVASIRTECGSAPGMDPTAIDAMQDVITAVYGDVNRRRTPEYLFCRFLAATQGVTGGMISVDSDYRDRRVRANLPKTFAWFFAVLSSVNARPSQLLEFRYRDGCPYCEATPCACESRPHRTREEMNNALLARLENQHDSLPPPSPTSIAEFQQLLGRIYEERNAKHGAGGVSAHTTESALRALGAMIHFDDESSEGIEILHLELADTLAWILALVDEYSRLSPYDFHRAFATTFPLGCYKCGATRCRCMPLPSDIRLANWRSYDGDI